jgi:hypothetical protein
VRDDRLLQAALGRTFAIARAEDQTVRVTRAAFLRLLDDLTLVTLAFAIALGWSLYQLAHGVSQLVSSFLVDYPPGAFSAARFSEPLTWNVGGRLLTFGPLLRGAIDLAVVLIVALVVYGRHRDGERES